MSASAAEPRPCGSSWTPDSSTRSTWRSHPWSSAPDPGCGTPPKICSTGTTETSCPAPTALSTTSSGATEPAYAASAHQRVEQPLELRGRVCSEATVHRAGLYDGAARRLEETEAGAEVLGRHGARRLVRAAHRLDELEAVADRVHVDPGRKAPEPIGRDLPGGVEELLGLAVDDDADVDELLTLDARDAAQHDVLVGLHAAALPGTQARAPSRRARRKVT